MIAQLERLYDADEDAARRRPAAWRRYLRQADLPSGDELAGEIERFLRDQGKGS